MKAHPHYVEEAARDLAREWKTDERWRGVQRDYTPHDVIRLRGRIPLEYTIASMGAHRLWHLLERRPFVRSLGALTGMQAVQMVRAGVEAIYLSGWQVAADNNLAHHTYPDQSLYPANSVPTAVQRINNALRRADQIDWVEGRNGTQWLAPIVADAEAGFGGPLNAYELMKEMIRAGAAGVHFEDQVAAEKKCGHMGGKVLVPTRQHVRTLQAARLAADVMGVPSILIARTDALGAKLLSNDADPADQPFLTGERTPDGYFRYRGSLDAAIQRGLAYSPYADLLWFETSRPDMEEARRFASAIHERFPGKPLAYNCSPSFHWKKHLSPADIATFQERLGALGYKFQFVTLAGFHSLAASMYELAHAYQRNGMAAYVELQEREFGLEAAGYSATRHQREVGTGYFDEIARILANGDAPTLALEGSTEQEQFEPASLLTRKLFSPQAPPRGRRVVKRAAAEPRRRSPALEAPIRERVRVIRRRQRV